MPIGPVHRRQRQRHRAAPEREADRRLRPGLESRARLHALHHAAEHVLRRTARKGEAEILLRLAEEAQQRGVNVDDAAFAIANHHAGAAAVERGAQTGGFISRILKRLQLAGEIADGVGSVEIGSWNVFTGGAAQNGLAQAPDRMVYTTGNGPAGRNDSAEPSNAEPDQRNGVEMAEGSLITETPGRAAGQERGGGDEERGLETRSRGWTEGAAH